MADEPKPLVLKNATAVRWGTNQIKVTTEYYGSVIVRGNDLDPGSRMLFLLLDDALFEQESKQPKN